MADLLTSIRAEIDARLHELEPAIAEYERLSSAADALLEEGRAASRSARRVAPRSSAPARVKKRTPVKATRRAPKREQPAAHTPAGQAILAALEHGSHTLAELVTVTALRAPEVREALRPLRARKTIVKTDRDGRAAYALPSAETG